MHPTLLILQEQEALYMAGCRTFAYKNSDPYS